MGRRSGLLLASGPLTMLLAVLGSLVFASSVHAAPLGITGFFGNPAAAGETTGGRFSTTPQGVAVNDTTDQVYVADAANNRIERFDEDGNFEWAVGFDVVAAGKPGYTPLNEQQSVTIGGNPTGGNFKLRFGAVANTTAPIPFNATAPQVQSALEALATIGAGNVIVTVAPGGNLGGGAGPGGPWKVEFTGTLANSPVVQMSGTSELTPSGTVTIATTVEGATAFEKCTVAADCKAGTGTTSVNAQAPLPGGGMASPQGIAINQATGDLYVSDAGFFRIQQLDEDGNFIRAWGRDVVQAGKPGDSSPASAVQTLTVDAEAGTFKLSFQGQSTADLAFNASAATVQGALQGLSTIGAGNATVSGGPGGPGGGTPYVIAFAGSLANNPEPLIVASNGTTALSGGAGTATVANTTTGANGFEICNAAADCKQGSEGNSTGGAFSNTIGYLAVAPAGAPNEGDVLVGDGLKSRVQEFSATGQFVRAFGWDVVKAGPGNTGSAFEVCRAADFDVCKSGAGGSGIGQFANLVTPSLPNLRVAVDTAGNIFTVEPTANFRVQKFAPSGGGLTPTLFNPQITALPGEGAEPEFPLSGASSLDTPSDIAVDPTDDHLYVTKACTAAHCPGAATPTERRLYEFETAGTGALVETHLAGYAVPAVRGLAVKAGGEAAYLTSSTPKSGVFIAGPPVPPHATAQAPTAVSTECATFHGTVNPEGGGPLGLLHTFYRFEYRPVGGSAWSKVPSSDIDLGSGEADVAVEQSVCGLQPNREYEVKVVATKGGSPTASNLITFTTDPAAPTVQTFAAFFDANAKGLVLRGSVNPNNTATTYYFEYGTAPCSSSTCAAVPASKDASAGSGGEAVVVSQRLAGLDPETTYHFRIVADNGVGAPVVGAEETIATPLGDADPCPNQQFRTGPSEALPECRAYEWVSNGDSWGSGIGGIVGSVADDGNRAGFQAQAFGQPPSVPGPSTPYTAERTASGWTVRAMLPEPSRAEGSGGGSYFMPSADLANTLWPEASLGQRLRGELRWGVNHLDGSLTPASGLIVPVNHSGEGMPGDQYPLLGAASDLSTLVFRYSSTALGSGVALLPGEPLLREPERSNLYEISGGTLRIVNLGATPTGENPLGIIGGACGVGLGPLITAVEGNPFFAGAVSVDGSVVHFSARPTAAPAGGTCNSAASPKRLYKRIDGTTTVEVSACAKANPNACTTAGDDLYRGASRDGGTTFFISPRQLTDSDTDSTSDLYVYDESLPANERLIQASAGETVPGDHPTIGSGAEVQGVLDNAADGSRVYFTAKGRLTSQASKGANNLYVFERDAAHPSGRITFVGALASGETNATSSFYALPGGEGDGHFALFTSAAKLLAEDADSSKDLYRYEDENGTLECLSCMGEGSFDVSIARRATEASWADYPQRSRPASADVSTAVFTTKEGLVDDDLNGANDVYRWQEGTLALVSAGSGEAGAQGSANESGISPDGEDVFFITRAAMVGADVNNGLDLYDARVGGGFAEAPVTAECLSDPQCHGAQGTPPPAKSPSSANFNGTGNPKQPKPCKKGFVRKKGKCVKKHKPAKHHKHKAKKHGAKKRANDDRGAKR